MPNNSSENNSSIRRRELYARLVNDDNNPFNKEEPWGKRGERILKIIGKKAANMAAIHTEAAYNFKKNDERCSLPPIYIPITISVYAAIVALYEPNNAAYQIATILGTGITAGWSAYLKAKSFGEQKVQNFTFATKCQELSLEINKVLDGIDRSHRIHYDVFLERISAKYKCLLEEQPELPENLSKKLNELNDAIVNELNPKSSKYKNNKTPELKRFPYPSPNNSYQVNSSNNQLFLYPNNKENNIELVIKEQEEDGKHEDIEYQEKFEINQKNQNSNKI